MCNNYGTPFYEFSRSYNKAVSQLSFIFLSFNIYFDVFIKKKYFVVEQEKESLRDAVHKPAESWTEAKKTEKIKDKLERSKQRREISSKLE